jgi:hypothetical protein
MISYMSGDKTPVVCSVCGFSGEKTVAVKKEKISEIIDIADAPEEIKEDPFESKPKKKGYVRKFSQIKDEAESDFGAGFEVDK